MKLENNSILIIDDEPGIRDGLSELLQNDGFEIYTAANGREALDRLRENKITPNAVLLDLFMPEMNGLEFLVAIRSGKDQTFKNLPVILMTAGSKDLGMVEAASKLANEYIKKPLNVDALLSQLKNFSGQTRLN
jgi:CheY-like chemotaxis protein